MIAAVNYASLSLVDISFRAIQPLFFSTPVEAGGLGLLPPTIGKILSCFGVLNGVVNVFFFAKIHDRWGTKNVFTAGIASAILVFATFPILNTIARAQGLSIAVWVGVALQVMISVLLSLSYGELTVSSPKPSSGLVSSQSIFHCTKYLACRFRRVRLHIYSCCFAQPSLSGWYKWYLSMRCLHHTGLWTSTCQFAFLLVYGKRLSWWNTCLLRFDWHSLLGSRSRDFIATTGLGCIRI